MSTETTALLSRPGDPAPLASNMGRNTEFSSPARQPLKDHPEARLQKDKVNGPLPGFNPTRARFVFAPSTESVPDPSSHVVEQAPPIGDAQLAWRSRDNRKGRHVLVVPATHSKHDSPQLTTTGSAIAQNIWRMCTVMAWWDVSWWIAVLFSVGSAIFVISGFFYWLPLAAPSTEFPNEDTIGGGITAFIGATLFTIGGVLLIVEASNENQTGCFGWAIERAFSHSDSDSAAENSEQTKSGGNASVHAQKGGKFLIRAKQECTHHHGAGVHRTDTLHLQHPDAGRKWEWAPTWHELRSHYFHEIGFMASFVLAIGAVIFYVSGIMALPWIYNQISQPVLYGTYWLAYLVGGVLFVASSALYMLETQPNFYTPAPRVIGWWIGVWNMIGSVGWTLSASFGYCSASWCAYQSDLSLLWASVAFLIGSLLLWYESLDKYPVVRAKA